MEIRVGCHMCVKLNCIKSNFIYFPKKHKCIESIRKDNTLNSLKRAPWSLVRAPVAVWGNFNLIFTSFCQEISIHVLLG